jgi:hypothetical protein
MSRRSGEKRMKGMGRVVFIAHLDAIRAELDAGWPIKAVFQKRADKLAISYAQFARYVDKIVRGNARGRAAPPEQSPNRGQPPADPLQPPRRKTDPFHHSPVAREGEIDDLLGPNFLKRR